MAEDASRPFSFVSGLTAIFEGSDEKAKNEALSEILSNLTITDKKPNVYLKNEFEIIHRHVSAMRMKKETFEPEKALDKQGPFQGFDADISSMLAVWEDVRTFFSSRHA